MKKASWCLGQVVFLQCCAVFQIEKGWKVDLETRSDAGCFGRKPAERLTMKATVTNGDSHQLYVVLLFITYVVKSLVEFYETRKTGKSLPTAATLLHLPPPYFPRLVSPNYGRKNKEAPLGLIDTLVALQLSTELSHPLNPVLQLEYVLMFFKIFFFFFFFFFVSCLLSFPNVLLRSCPPSLLTNSC